MYAVVVCSHGSVVKAMDSKHVAISHWWPMTAPLHQNGTGQSTYGHVQAFTMMNCTALKGVVML